MKRLTAILFAMLTTTSWAQKTDSTSTRNQVLKLAFTPRFIYNKAWVVSYERVVRPHQSFSVTGGIMEFPRLFSYSSGLQIQEGGPRSGYTIGADYRFYMKKENKYTAPHGIYIGPFTSFYRFNSQYQIVDSSTGAASTLNNQISFLNIGVQIGYQFVFNDRWTFDVVFLGPSVSMYQFDMKLNGSLSADQGNEVVQRVLDGLPLLKELINSNEVNASGSSTQWSVGYRFTAMVGYKFGFK